MAEKFKNKYRIGSLRKPNWNYGSDGFYFVTICTGNRSMYFGDVQNGEMHYSEVGQLAKQFWQEIPKHFPFIRLDEFQIKPNHVHGLIEINHKSVETPNLGVSTDIPNPPNLGVSTDLPNPPNVGVSTKPNDNRKKTIAASEKWKPGTLGTIMNQYKRVVTNNARKIVPEFSWQSRYYDHIVRNDQALDRIRNYIRNNPKNWKGNN